MARNRRWNENAAWAVLITNVHGRKDKDVPITAMADATHFLVDKYGSHEAVSREASERRLKLSREMVRNFYNISLLDPKTKKLVDTGAFGIDVARRLSAIRDVNRRYDTAKAVSDLDAFTGRHVIEYVIKSPKLSVEDCRERVLSQKPEKIEVNAVVIPFDQEEFARLQRFARSKRLEVTEVARKAVIRFLNEHSHK
jgi:hypothetical protein